MNGEYKGRRHPDFAAGNVARATHGTKSRRLVDERVAAMVDAEELPTVDAVVAAVGWLDPGDRWAISAWQRAEARRQMLDDHIARLGMVDDAGEIRVDVLRLIAHAERDASSCRARLGLDPTSRARLAKDTSVARHFAGNVVASIEAAGAEALDAADQREAVAPRPHPQVAQVASDATTSPVVADGPQGPENATQIDGGSASTDSPSPSSTAAETVGVAAAVDVIHDTDLTPLPGTTRGACPPPGCHHYASGLCITCGHAR